MSSLAISYPDFLKKFPKYTELDPKDLPKQIKITTMTITMNLPVLFYTGFIANHVPLNDNFINAIKLNNDVNFYRMTDNFAKTTKIRKPKANNNKRKNFYHQCTVVIINEENNINVNFKIFKNGTIQVTGSKNVSSVFWAIYNLFDIFTNCSCDCVISYPHIPLYSNDFDDRDDIIELNKFDRLQQIFDSYDNDSIISSHETSFVYPKHLCSINNMLNFDVVMINNVFAFNFKINLIELYSILSKYKYSVSYDPSNHSAVNFKYKSDITGKETTAIIYNKGPVVMLGSINYEDIVNCYVFICKVVLDNYDKIKC